MRLVAFAVPAAIERDHAEVLGELFNDTEGSPAADAPGEAVDENNRFALSDVDVANLDAVRVEELVLQRQLGL
jgi:hypothetical protein